MSSQEAQPVLSVTQIQIWLEQPASQSVGMERNKLERFVMLEQETDVWQTALHQNLAFPAQEDHQPQLQHALACLDTLYQELIALFIVGTLWCTLLRPVMMEELEDATQLVQESM
jgi:hypothetical protein